MHRLCLRLILLLTLTLAGCDGAREPALETQRPALDYSWVATTPRAELAGHFDRANVFIYADYYRRQRAYASGEIPPRLLPDSYTSHPLAYYTLKREPAVRTPAEPSAAPAENPAARHFARGLAYYDLGDFDGAIAEFSRAIQLDGRHARAYAFRALCYGYMGNTAEAQADLQSAIRLKADPTLIAEVRRGLRQ